MDRPKRGSRIAFGLVLLAASAMLGCQSISGNNRNQGLNNSALMASPMDFGMTVVGGTKTLTETIHNQESSPVTISAATVEGASFGVIGPRFPLTVPPGGSAALSFSFTPHTSGSLTGRVSITSNASPHTSESLIGRVSITSNASNPNTYVLVSGFGVVSPGQLSVNPPSISFGNLAVGQRREQIVTLTNSGDSDVTVSAATVTGSAFSLSGLSLPQVLAANQSTTLTVVFSPPSEGIFSTAITVASKSTGRASITSNASNLNTYVLVSGFGVGSPGQLSVNPPSISFGNLAVGQRREQIVTLTNSGDSDVTVSAATVTGSAFSLGGLSLPQVLAANQSTALTVVFSPPSEGIFSTAITVASKSTGRASITSNASNRNTYVLVSGFGVGSPGQLSVNPPSISFGNLAVGQRREQIVTLTNSGDSDVTVSAATVTGSAFSLSGPRLPQVLAANQSTALTVVFSPPSEGTFGTAITVASKSPSFNLNLPLLNVPLSGNGVSSGNGGGSSIPAEFFTMQMNSGTVGR